MRLKTFAQALNTHRFAGVGHVRAGVGLGYQVNQGRQHKIFVRVRGEITNGCPDYTDVLFRVYVPPNGFPVEVERFGEDPAICENIVALVPLRAPRWRSMKTMGGD